MVAVLLRVCVPVVLGQVKLASYVWLPPLLKAKLFPLVSVTVIEESIGVAVVGNTAVALTDGPVGVPGQQEWLVIVTCAVTLKVAPGTIEAAGTVILYG